MLRLNNFQTGAVLLLTACGGNVANDGAQTPGSSATGGQGATGASGGAATSATGGNGSWPIRRTCAHYAGAVGPKLTQLRARA